MNAGPLVLIVEDNIDQRDLLRLNFERAGCTAELHWKSAFEQR